MQGNARRVIVNTGVLYGKMLLTIGISLFSTRIVLKALGTVDFGIYSLVAGVVALLAFLNSAMSVATQRFLSYHQGKGDEGMLRRVFFNSVFLHLSMALLLVVLLELMGMFLFNGFLNIPAERAEAAVRVYHWVVVSLFFTVLTVPYTGALVAREDIIWVAVVGIFEVVARLVVALLLLQVQWDKLTYYAGGLAGITAVCFVIYSVICVVKYPECRPGGRPDQALVKQLLSFTGWNLFGALCSLGRTQGLAVILNLFLGSVVNAAYGIANQVSGQLNFFSSTLLRAINPQIMKSEGAGDRERMLRLSMTASKFAFFLFCLVGIPMIFEMERILSLWLQEVPDYTVAFCRIVIMSMIVNQVTIGLQSTFQAIGSIRTYQIVVGSIVLLTLPLYYLFMALGVSPVTAMYTMVVVEIAACTGRVYLLGRLVDNVWPLFWSQVLSMEIIPVLLQVFACLLTITLLEWPFRFLITFGFSGIILAGAIYILGLNRYEKEVINGALRKLPLMKKLPV